MLYLCFRCNNYSFYPYCPVCGSEALDDHIPLEPEYYPEFQYQSKGILKDIFVKRKTQKELSDKLERVLLKYSKFETPYFVNYVHISRNADSDIDELSTYSNLKLFKNVLVRLGFNELEQLPQLTTKLIRSTDFRFTFSDFIRRTKHHISSQLVSTLRSWIEEMGTAYRRDLHLFLYYLWQEKIFVGKGEIKFPLSNEKNDNIPLIRDSEIERIINICEEIYLDIRIEKFKIKLERFDPSKFITIYAVDCMAGFDFEDFLVKLFTTLGYDVQTTKRTADQGADLFVTKFGEKMVIQAKNYTENVGNAAVQQVLAAKNFYSCNNAMVVTNSYYTSSAKELANSVGVRLIDRKEFQSYLDEYNQAILEASDSTE